MNKRDLFLQQMGITQWRLHRPESLKGAVQIFPAENTRLVIISDQPLNKNAVLFKDILLTLNISERHCIMLDFEQAQHLNATQSAAYWLLGKNSEKIDRTLLMLKNMPTVWQSPDLTDFAQDSAAKRRLWQQMQSYLSQHTD